MDEASEKSESSERHMAQNRTRTVEGFDKVIESNGNTVIVANRERLFFLVPIDIKSTVTLNEEGEIVIDEKKSVWNWFLSILSA